MSLYRLEMEHLGPTHSDMKEPLNFAMDMKKVYSDANGLSAGRRAPFNVRVAFLPTMISHGQSSQSLFPRHTTLVSFSDSVSISSLL